MLDLMILAQTAPPAPAGLTATADPIPTIFHLVVQGGLVMIPIGLCSIIALAIIVERIVITRRARVIPPSFVASLPDRLDDPERVIAAAKADGSPVANLVSVIARKHGQPLAVIEKRVEEAGLREIVHLRKRMRVLSALPQVATMLGLLGTIFGMIRTFRAVAASGEALGKTEMLAKGIHEAWVATAAGLAVAIPVMIAYHWLQTRIDGLVADLDATVRDRLDQWEPAPSAVEPAGGRLARPAPIPSPNGEPAAEPAAV